MESELRVTLPLVKVLGALMNDPAEETYGARLSQETGLKSGTLYPILVKLELRGFTSSRWEDIDPVAEGRPARRLYTLTGTGVRFAEQALRETRAALTPHRIGVSL